MTNLWEQPTHLYSHVQGTVLDTVLDAVDKLAGEVARRSTPVSGWLHGANYPLACFEVSHKGRENGEEVSIWVQQQDIAPTINQRVVAQYMKERAQPAPNIRPELAAYTSLVTQGASRGDNMWISLV